MQVLGMVNTQLLFLAGFIQTNILRFLWDFDLPATLLKRDISLKTQRIIIAPLVNPDGFVRQNPTRTNANGVDPNRNFFTEDWHSKAISGGKEEKTEP